MLDDVATSETDIAANPEWFSPVAWSRVERSLHARLATPAARDRLRVAVAKGGICLGVACARMHGGSAAWIEWLALADSAPASFALRMLLAKVQAWATESGAGELCVLDKPFSWLLPYWRDFGFSRVDTLLEYERQLDHRPSTPEAEPIRPAVASDIARIVQIDTLAFQPRMRFSALQLSEYLAAPSSLLVWARAADALGYLAARQSDGVLHIDRLAVHPEVRRRGVGRALLVAALGRAMPGSTARLNTPGSASAAQRLYQRMGFRRTPGDTPIMRRSVP